MVASLHACIRNKSIMLFSIDLIIGKDLKTSSDSTQKIETAKY